jgi:ATP-binding cassette subfamily F protein uup
VRDPDILLLDEPTNHLDIEAIVWLEEFLSRFGGTLLFVTHDRVFLRKLATRIIELDRGRLVDWSCDYDTFLERKQAVLDAETVQWARFDKKLAQEEVWLRQGVKARRTRNEGRVTALEKMREARFARRERTGTARMQIQEAERSGKLVVETEGVGFSYGGRPVIHDFSCTVMRGDKVGIIGPNGAGKTTLLRLLVGELPPEEGRLRLGARLEPAYFDQLRAQLDDGKSVQDNVADGGDTVTVNGAKRHVIGYLRDFLFSPDRARSPVGVLSGGERNRLLLARLFTKPSNVLVLDEPTNDLDAETLDLLEDLLLDYPGTIFLVSHDRAFLNNVVTSTLVFEGEGRVAEYIGGYDDWLRQRDADRSAMAGKPRTGPEKLDKPAKPEKAERRGTKPDRPRKLSFNELRELESLPERIEAMEAEQKAIYESMADPEFYKRESGEVVKLKLRLETLEQELEQAYGRWETLEAIAG